MQGQNNFGKSILNVSAQNPIGAVMVVGGGIAGMQAALDLADQGFKVYLVEKKSAIGGHMAQLDKTFPTNDCAMCNISPKLVDVGRHLNIEILTDSEVLNIDGTAGDFNVTLKRNPRYVDVSKCVGCGDCVTVCPVSIANPYEEGLEDHKAAYRLYTQAVPSAYAIEKAGVAPCRDGCPAGQRAQGYIALIAEGRYREALRVIKEDNPFPSVCGRTCHHPCEGACSRALIDQAVSIMGLKRFVVDYSLAYGREPVTPAARTEPEWVAVVGAGPAGLTAAHDLAKLGYGVTIYEALPVAGGMMRVGIPAHRLPKGVLQQDIDDILSLGVVLKTNSPVKNPAALLDEGYDAVCLATGISSRDHSLGFEGEEAEGVHSAATFLRKINLGEPVTIGERVAVVGGGITALDAAAVARRLGPKEVHLVLDRPRGELPAYHWELEAVDAEGINLIERATVTRIRTQDDKVVGIDLSQTAPGTVVDSNGRRRPKLKAGTEFILDVDTVIATIGQFSDLNYLDTQFDDLVVDRHTFACEIPGLFIVAGRKTGASYIIDAVALGHQVSTSIHRYLKDQPLTRSSSPGVPVAKSSRQELNQRVESGEISVQPRAESAMLPMEERVTGFREVILGLTEHQARYEAARCLQCGVCSECLACVYACGTDAIDHDMIAKEVAIDVGAVILAPGYQAYHAELSEEFGYGRYQNVITALQFERLLSASGPTMGHVTRISDNKPPQRIAFLQCIGSRDQEHDYCSAVCCMYATKEAMIAKEHSPGMDVHIFMMDMRAFSKGYWSYFERAKQRYGIQYHRSRVSSLQEDPLSNDLILQYCDENGESHVEQFDMVVLSVGMEISESVKELGKQIGVELDQYGFCHTVQFNPLETNRPGVYAVGPFREPKDIPESIVEASGAAASSATLLSNSRWKLSQKADYPTEKDVANEKPRIGIFVCHCGSNIGGFLDVPELTEYARGLPHVVHTEHSLYACSQDSIKLIAERIQEQNLNRVIVASCSPLTHGPLFQDCLRSTGLNPYLLEMANIRNQCSWVHSDDWDVATEKSKDLVRMAVARSALLAPQTMVEVSVERSALVVGGGAAGMTAALTLANQGFPVYLVEKESELGGNLRFVYTSQFATETSQSQENPQVILEELTNEVTDHPAIQTHVESTVTNSSGFRGNFSSTIRDKNGRTTNISHGITILATGGVEYQGPEFGFGTHAGIITQLKLEDLLENHFTQIQALNSVVMIQCIGPAEKYCSRICCLVALKNAIQLKKINPKIAITILYKDIRVYGFKERLYQEARRLGIIFLRYDNEHIPSVTKNPKITGEVGLKIRAWDTTIRRYLHLEPDLVVLSMPVVPGPETQQLASIFKVSTDSDGFFSEAHIKLRPVDSTTDGIFMAGMALYPKLLDETIIQAQAAASIQSCEGAKPRDFNCWWAGSCCRSSFLYRMFDLFADLPLWCAQHPSRFIGRRRDSWCCLC
jgi:heterodisulfide reductase subunit A-like polyferredoxin